MFLVILRGYLFLENMLAKTDIHATVRENAFLCDAWSATSTGFVTMKNRARYFGNMCIIGFMSTSITRPII